MKCPSRHDKYGRLENDLHSIKTGKVRIWQVLSVLFWKSLLAFRLSSLGRETVATSYRLCHPEASL